MYNLLNTFSTFFLEAAENPGNSWTLILFPVIMFGALWLFAIRPQKKREKETAAMRNSIDIGDTLTTIGGITGRVISIRDEEDEVIIETGNDKTRIRIKRWAISNKELPPESDADNEK